MMKISSILLLVMWDMFVNTLKIIQFYTLGSKRIYEFHFNKAVEKGERKEKEGEGQERKEKIKAKIMYKQQINSQHVFVLLWVHSEKDTVCPVTQCTNIQQVNKKEALSLEIKKKLM